LFKLAALAAVLTATEFAWAFRETERGLAGDAVLLGCESSCRRCVFAATASDGVLGVTLGVDLWVTLVGLDCLLVVVDCAVRWEGCVGDGVGVRLLTAVAFVAVLTLGALSERFVRG